MVLHQKLKILGLMLALTMLSACASLPESLVSTPEVRLQNVQVMGLGFTGQTFLLSFDVHNPNPFPLPVNHVSYGLRLDGHRFASGRTASEFSVPAGGDSEFAISVELNLLSTAPQLLSVVKNRSRTEIPYELEGQLGIDIPMTPPISYRSNGAIRLNSSND